MANRIQLRRGTAAEAASANPILAEGEIAVELDTSFYKIGDGITDWNSLPYSSGKDGPIGPVGPVGGSATAWLPTPESYNLDFPVYRDGILWLSMQDSNVDHDPLG